MKNEIQSLSNLNTTKLWGITPGKSLMGDLRLTLLFGEENASWKFLNVI